MSESVHGLNNNFLSSCHQRVTSVSPMCHLYVTSVSPLRHPLQVCVSSGAGTAARARQWTSVRVRRDTQAPSVKLVSPRHHNSLCY